MSRFKTCAAEAVGGARGDLFSVSKTTGTNIDGCVLNVRRCRWLAPELAERLDGRETPCGRLLVTVTRGVDGLSEVMFPLPDDGREFASTDEAARFCVERGYTRRYFTSPNLRADRVARGDAIREDMLRWREAQS